MYLWHHFESVCVDFLENKQIELEKNSKKLLTYFKFLINFTHGMWIEK